MSDAGIKFMGQNPTGRAKGVAVDRQGRIRKESNLLELVNVDINSYEEFTHIGTNGVGGISSRNIIDSNFEELYVQIKNNTNGPLLLDRIYVFSSEVNNINFREDKNVSFAIPSGSTLVLTKKDLPFLDEYAVGFTLRINASGASSGTFNVSVRGKDNLPKLVETVKVVESLEIRSTNSEYIEIDARRFRSLTVLVRHNLNKGSGSGVNLLLRPHINVNDELTSEFLTATRIYDGQEWINFIDKPLTIPYINETGHDYVINSAWNFLDNISSKKFTLRLNATDVPTDGKVTIVVWGRRA